MEEKGVVSLWIGDTQSKADFDKAMNVSFSEDGDFLGSAFSRSQGTGYYDSGLMEAVYRDKQCSDLDDLLRGASYEDQILAQFKSLWRTCKANCFVLLYDYRSSATPEFVTATVRLRFCGIAEFTP